MQKIYWTVLLRAFKNAGGIKITFTAQAPEGSSTGVIRLKGDKFLLETDGVTTWFDGHTQWSYLSSSDEVNVSEPTAEELQSVNPYALLSLYKQGYNLKLGKVDNPRFSSLYKVVLTATGRKQDLQCIILYVTKIRIVPSVSVWCNGGGIQWLLLSIPIRPGRIIRIPFSCLIKRYTLLLR